MKRVTLLLPDKLISVGGSSRWTCREELPTTPENVIKALTSNDYHLNYYFAERSVAVQSIEDIQEEVEVIPLTSFGEEGVHPNVE